MGSGSSKSRRFAGTVDGGGASGAPSSSSLSPGSTRSASRGRSVIPSSCLGLSSRTGYDSDDDEQVFEQQDEETSSVHHVESESEEVKLDGYQKLRIKQPEYVTCVSSDVELSECGQGSSGGQVRGARGRCSRVSSCRSLNRSGRFLSRFSFLPGNASCRQAYPLSPMSFNISSDDEVPQLGSDYPDNLVDGNVSQENSSSLSAYFSNTSPGPSYGDGSGNLHLNFPSSSLPRTSQECRVLSSGSLVGDNSSDTTQSLRSQAEIGDLNSRNGDNRAGEPPGDRNVRFSRTLSVGRLRDRVLRRSSFSDMAFSPMRQERELDNSNQSAARQAGYSWTRAGVSEENAETPNAPGYSPSNMPNSFDRNHNHGGRTLQSRESRYNDLLEQRSNFLERRRRIRSQVRALQRLGSRFENLSGHERSCVLSGQNRSGHCTCRVNSRDISSTDDNGTRASMSRIVMLAEALFEVLDEIHQQSVVLSSRPSVSAIGSVPAPDEVVESLTVKVHSKSNKTQNEEVPQCYICLVEYEEGDNLRVLPCHHEFHRLCVDKWLKEIHRVCPLCRRDICKPDSLSVES